MSKRRYRNALAFIESGLTACWVNALDLVDGSKTLLEAGLHAPATSLAVLAVEELAKFAAIDGLLFARPDDHKATRFSKASKSHSEKLVIFELFPLMIGNLCRVDPRYGKEKRFNLAVAAGVEQLKQDGNKVMELLGGGAFERLDTTKQTGFYVSASNSGFTAPRDAITPDKAQAVYQLAWRATTTIDFVLKDGNLQRYLAQARSVRAKLTDADHAAFERLALDEAERLFGLKDSLH